MDKWDRQKVGNLQLDSIPHWGGSQRFTVQALENVLEMITYLDKEINQWANPRPPLPKSGFRLKTKGLKKKLNWAEKNITLSTMLRLLKILNISSLSL